MGGEARVLLTPSTAAELPHSWCWHRLDRICEGVFDCPHSTPILTDDGPYLARSQDIRSGIFRTEDAAHVSPATYKERIVRAQPRHGDLLYSREGTYFGIAAEVPAGIQVCLGQRMVLLRPALSVVETRFLRYWLNSPTMALHISGYRDGSVAERLNLPTIRGLPVAIPPLAEQHAIAYILGALDDKIELNRRMNETLQAMARTLFKSWLQDCDSVTVKVSDLIGDRVLEIGDGYRAKNSELGRPGLPFIRAGDLNNGFHIHAADVLRDESVANAGTKVSRPGDVAFTSKGTIGRFARVTDFTRPFVYSPQVCFWRSLDAERLRPSILYFWMQSDDLRSQIDAVAGQTDMAPYVSLRDQRVMQMPVFPRSQHEVADRLDVLLTRQALADEESETLVALRDALLPKLISGQLRVKDAKRFVERVS